ncbi:hypothetical protein HZB07_00245 [Candidatus Saganbacteria bacterium]|nr:hypothetical protein [Candidatus Saganbacteria bacterium]
MFFRLFGTTAKLTSPTSSRRNARPNLPPVPARLTLPTTPAPLSATPIRPGDIPVVDPNTAAVQVAAVAPAGATPPIAPVKAKINNRDLWRDSSGAMDQKQLIIIGAPFILGFLASFSSSIKNLFIPVVRLFSLPLAPVATLALSGIGLGLGYGLNYLLPRAASLGVRGWNAVSTSFFTAFGGTVFYFLAQGNKLLGAIIGTAAGLTVGIYRSQKQILKHDHKVASEKLREEINSPPMKHIPPRGMDDRLSAVSVGESFANTIGTPPAGFLAVFGGITHHLNSHDGDPIKFGDNAGAFCGHRGNLPPQQALFLTANTVVMASGSTDSLLQEEGVARSDIPRELYIDDVRALFKEPNDRKLAFKPNITHVAIEMALPSDSAKPKIAELKKLLREKLAGKYEYPCGAEIAGHAVVFAANRILSASSTDPVTVDRVLEAARYGMDIFQVVNEKRLHQNSGANLAAVSLEGRNLTIKLAGDNTAFSILFIKKDDKIFTPLVTTTPVHNLSGEGWIVVITKSTLLDDTAMTTLVNNLIDNDLQPKIFAQKLGLALGDKNIAMNDISLAVLKVS